MSHQKRIQALQALIETSNCQALLVDDKTNLFYLTGLELSAGKLIVDIKGAALFVDNRYLELAKKSSPVPVFLIETQSINEPLAKEQFRWIRTLGFDSSRTTHKAFLDMQKACSTLDITLKDLDDPIGKLRLLKDDGEVNALREAADLGSEGYDHLLSILKEGITEEEAARELEIFWKRRGSKGVAFDPIIAFGPHSSMPHYRAGNAKLAKGDVVLIDIGVNFHHYHSDMTRVVFFGEPLPKLVEIYTIVREAQEKALALCRPGTLVGDLDAAARQYIASKGFGDYFTHSLGHGVGLDIHEAPTLRNKPPYSQQPLEPGMVITIEPGIYLPGIGGVRLEDCVAIHRTGYENLTNRSKEITIF